MRDVQKLINLINNGAAKDDVLAGLEALNQRLSYGLFWDEDHPENVETFDEQERGAYPVITANPALSQLAQADRPTHLLIEGDNYHALSVLAYTHANAVDLVLIDPPYNTGEDFIYNDHRVIKSDDPFKSTKWLTFMKKRLLLAKSILKPDGLIFVCIDDNEQATLKLLMDSVFPGKFVTTIHVEMSGTQGMKVKAAKNGNVVKNGEYILVYAMDGRKNIFRKPLYNPSEYDSHYSLWLDETAPGRFSERPLTDVLLSDPKLLEALLDADVAVRNKQGKVSLSAKKLPLAYKVPSVRKFINDNRTSVFRSHYAEGVSVPESTLRELAQGQVTRCPLAGRDYLLTLDSKGQVSQRICIDEKIREADDFYQTHGPTTIRGDWWPGFYLDMGNVSKEGGVDFKNGKKPLRLFKQIIDATTPKDGLVVDFFAGSGTTMHAVAALNAEAPADTKRQAIIVTNNEANICREKTRPRCLNALAESAVGDGLAFFETAFIPKVAVSRDEVARQIGANCIDILCVKTKTYAAPEERVFAQTWAMAKGPNKGVVLVHGKPSKTEFNELKVLLDASPELDWQVFAFSYDSSLSDPAIARSLGIDKVSPIPSELTRIFKTAYGY